MNDDAVVDRNALMVVFPVPNVAWWGDELCGATSQSIEIINYLGLRRRVVFSFSGGEGSLLSNLWTSAFLLGVY